MTDPVVFTKQQRCGECDEPLNQGENWGCARAFVPVYGFVAMAVEIHRHLHVKCASGHLRWLVLRNLGLRMLGEN